MTSARRVVGGLLAVTIGVASLAVAASFFGAAFHPFDSIAHFRAHIAVVLLLLALAALAGRRWISMLAAVAGAALGLGTTLPLLWPGQGQGEPAAASGPVYTLLQMNLLLDADDKAEAVRRIADSRPDVVTLQEVTQDWQALFAGLNATYPYQAYCGTERRDGSGILSRRPFADGESTALCRPRYGLISRGIDFNGRIVNVSSLHLEWPWPKSQWWQITGMAPLLGALPQPSLLAGDFNAAPWSAAVRAVAEAGRWRVVSGIGPSWMTLRFPSLPARPFGLPIDNLLVSPQIGIRGVGTLSRTASDHLPLLLRFSLEPEAPGRPPLAVVSR